MRHHHAGRTLGRDRDQRAALLRSLARSLILRGGITTTEARAKELRPFVEKLVTKSKTDTVTARRTVAGRLGDQTQALSKLFKTIGPRYKEQGGGYTRIIKVGINPKDGRREARIEFV
jgi:large subunit ribosomal protein L17